MKKKWGNGEEGKSKLAQFLKRRRKECTKGKKTLERKNTAAGRRLVWQYCLVFEVKPKGK